MTTRSRRRRRLVPWLIVLVVLAVLVVGADRGGAAFAEYTASSTIQRSKHVPSRPDVSIAGVAFLTQLAAGDFHHVTVTAHDVPVQRNANVLTLAQVRAVLHEVHVSNGFSTVRADTADATALVDYAELSHRVGSPVRYAGRGRISTTRKLTVAGSTINVTISAHPQLRNNSLGFGAPSVGGLGALSGLVNQALSSAGGAGGALNLSVPLRDVPFNLQARSISADARGVTVVFTGRDLTFTK